MNKIKGILISTLLLLSILTIISPVSAGTIHVYPGEDIVAKINGAASGDTVYIHAGTYTVTSSINISEKNLTIIGDGASNTILNFAGNGRIYVGLESGSSNITVNISGITLKADPISTPIIILRFYNNFDNSNLTLTGNVKDCVFDKAGWECLRADADHNDSYLIVTIENCEFKNATNAAGIHSYGYSQVTVKNCLIHDNYYGVRNEGTNSPVTVQSCTIDKNVRGIDYTNAGATGSVKDSIITNNTDYGILKSGGSGTVTCTYNNVWNNGTDYAGATAGAGSISQNPFYETGRLGAYYLSQSSPCVDKGSASAASLSLDKMTTRTDEKWDTGTVDMGYHYASNWLGKRGLPIAKILEILKLNKNK